MKFDGRSLDHAALEFIRKNAVQRIEAGESASDVMDSFKLCRTTAHKWLNSKAEGGMEALAEKKHPGSPCKLSDKQKKDVRKWICGKDPRQYGIDFGLWTRRIIQTLIAERMGIEISLATVGKILEEVGITPPEATATSLST